MKPKKDWFPRFFLGVCGLLVLVLVGSIVARAATLSYPFLLPQQVYHATVASITDGDTLRVNVHVHEGTTNVPIRIIGVDTPETAFRSVPEPYAKEATAELGKLLPIGTMIHIRTEVDTEDNFDRVLAHVYTHSGTHVGLRLVERGLAKATPYAPNTEMSEVLAKAEEKAKRAQLRIWGR